MWNKLKISGIFPTNPFTLTHYSDRISLRRPKIAVTKTIYFNATFSIMETKLGKRNIVVEIFVSNRILELKWHAKIGNIWETIWVKAVDCSFKSIRYGILIYENKIVYTQKLFVVYWTRNYCSRMAKHLFQPINIVVR